MRAGLGQLIERQTDLCVCGEAGNPADSERLLPMLDELCRTTGKGC